VESDCEKLKNTIKQENGRDFNQEGAFHCFLRVICSLQTESVFFLVLSGRFEERTGNSPNSAIINAVLSCDSQLLKRSHTEIFGIRKAIS
jgi:hypothetical protein